MPCVKILGEMIKNLLIIGILLITIGASLYFWQNSSSTMIITAIPIPKPTPLAKYSFESLKNRSYPGSEIKIERKMSSELGKDRANFTSYVFSFTTEGKIVTGQANLPKGNGPFPVIIMLRGYADKEIYFTGLGTRKAAGVFADNGFITLAPDFLGFGESDQGSEDILGVRFEKPITVLNLFQSIKTLKDADMDNIFLWGHSNGGQVAISYLEISQKEIPTILWAPVTRGFPDSVTDYLGELDDQGEMVLASISAFLKIYDPQVFSIKNYYKDIKTNLQIHQGMSDELIKTEWTNEFVGAMRAQGLSVNYYTYPRNDHNLSRDWDTVVERDLEFLRKHIK